MSELQHCIECRNRYICEFSFAKKERCKEQQLAAPVYTDGLYLIGESIEILHNFAKKIELDEFYFTQLIFPRYYLPDHRMKQFAINEGAREISTTDLTINGIFTKGRDIHNRDSGEPIDKLEG